MQLDAFDRVTFPRAHRNDPRSSHEAAAAGERTGRFKKQAEEVLWWNKKLANCTARELYEFYRQNCVNPILDVMAFRKRLGELVKVGLVDATLTKDTPPCAFAGSRDTRYTAR